ncbi:MAG: ion transporter, partial [Flavobacteriales bacterium]
DAGSTSPCISPAAAPGLAVSYFVSFVLIGTMIILNLFIGVIMNGMDDARAEMAEEDRLASKTDAIQIDDIEEKITELQGLLILYQKENS